jgi:hypothetical protein
VYLVAALAGSVALQPGEVAAGVDVEEVGLRRVPNVHGDIVMAAQKQQNKIVRYKDDLNSVSIGQKDPWKN